MTQKPAPCILKFKMKNICDFLNYGIAIIRDFEYNIIVETGGALWNTCPQEKLLINGAFHKGVLLFFVRRAE